MISDVVAERCFLSNNRKGILIKITSSDLEINIRFSLEEINDFFLFSDKKVETLKLGESAGNLVQWIENDGKLFLIVGADIDLWDIGLMFDWLLVDKIAEVIKNLGDPIAIT
jgi:hypothetical protein